MSPSGLPSALIILDTSQDKFLSNCSYFKTAYSQKVDSKFSHVYYCSSKISGQMMALKF
jgi:hypothetical protein